MNISFLRDDPLDTLILNTGKDDAPLYEIQTLLAGGHRTTLVRRTMPGIPAGGGELVSEVHWHRAFKSTTISYLGSTMPIDAFLRTNSLWSSSRTMTGSDGREYKWKIGSNKLILVDCITKAVIAESHRSKFGWFGPPRRMNIDISSEGVSTLDAIVVGFLVMEQTRREQRRRNARHNAALASTMTMQTMAASMASTAGPSC